MGENHRATIQIEFGDGLEMQNALELQKVRKWFDEQHPGQLHVVKDGELEISGPTPSAASSLRAARPGAGDGAPAGSAGDLLSPQMPQLASPSPTCTFETITPKIAGAWLDLNVSNRPMDKYVVSRYAALMESGKFMLTGDAIQFDTDSNLINGQHRLKAITASGMPQKMLVVRGLAPKVFQVLDYGKRRSPADALAIEGFVNARNLAALCKLICAWIAGKLETSTRLSVEPHYIVDTAYAFDDPEMAETASGAIRFTHNLYPKFRQLLPLSYVSFVYWAYARLGEDEKEKMQQFVEQLATGVGITDSRSPVGLLRAAMIDSALSDKKLPDFLRFGFTIQAARLHVAGASAESLKWRGEYPEPGDAPAMALITSRREG